MSMNNNIMPLPPRRPENLTLFLAPFQINVSAPSQIVSAPAQYLSLSYYPVARPPSVLRVCGGYDNEVFLFPCCCCCGLRGDNDSAGVLTPDCWWWAEQNKQQAVGGR